MKPLFLTTFIFAFLVLCQIEARSLPVHHEPHFFFSKKESYLQRAQAEGKHILIEFHASWCAPCRWMEDKTWGDPDVQHLLNKYYIPLRADLDQGEGFQLFQEYGVQVLPTFIILNAQGEVFARYEETIHVARMMEILLEASTGLSPSNQIAYRTEESPRQDQAREAPALLFDHIASVVNTEDTHTPPTPPAQGFAVQTGVYTLLPNVWVAAEQLRSLGEQPIWMESVESHGATIYKLLSGHFEDRQTAEAWRARLAEGHIPGYVRSLTKK
jgi:thiol-disulfide isomerase/thioredoxin